MKPLRLVLLAALFACACGCAGAGDLFRTRTSLLGVGAEVYFGVKFDRDAAPPATELGK